MNTLRFLFEGQRIADNQTPKEVGSWWCWTAGQCFWKDDDGHTSFIYIEFNSLSFFLSFFMFYVAWNGR